MSALKKEVYEPMKDVIISMQEIADAMAFWTHFKIEFVRIPGLPELVKELQGKTDLTLDDVERVKYLICYEIANNPHEAFSDEMWSQIKAECAHVVSLMEAYYPGRVWI